MNYCVIICIILIGIFLSLNFCYLYIVNKNSQENLIINGGKGHWDYVVVGSSYGRYGIDFSSAGVDGWNFSFGPQFLFYTDKILRQYSKSFNRKCIVIIVVGEIIFVSARKTDFNGAERYRRILNKEFLGEDYSFAKRLLAGIPLLFQPLRLIAVFKYFLLGKRNYIYTLKKNMYNLSELEKVAQHRCWEWCSKFGLNDTTSGIVSEEMEKEFSRSVDILKEMISFCVENDFFPILVVPPLSSYMNKQTTPVFVKKMLYDNIEKANVRHIPFLDYRTDCRLQDMDLYINADYLNAKGREIFTKILINDINKYVIA